MSLPRPAPFGREVVLEILPQRPPFVFVDSVLEADRDHAVATLALAPNDGRFAGHFPGEPVFPGALLIEAMAQTCLVVYAANFDRDELLFLTQAKARFLNAVRPPAELTIRASVVKLLKEVCLMSASVEVGGALAATSDLGFATSGYRQMLG